MSQWFEDLRVGRQISLGEHTFTEDDIIAFARQYDPQPFHVDPIAARDSLFGGLVASGWHTASIWMRLMADYQRRQAREGHELAPGERQPRFGISPGFKQLRWLQPVRPGDTLRFSARITGKTRLNSRPEWGLIDSRNEAVNQNGALVMSFIGQVFVERKTTG